MEKYQNKYRIKTHRMSNWDYSGNGIYFLTIVTQKRVCNLGNVNKGKMVLSDFGQIVEMEFLKSFKIRDELFLDEFIIMPNHLHTIIVLNKPEMGIGSYGSGSHDSHVDARPCVSTIRGTIQTAKINSFTKINFIIYGGF